jgi:hypothetical protein
MHPRTRWLPFAFTFTLGYSTAVFAQEPTVPAPAVDTPSSTAPVEQTQPGQTPAQPAVTPATEETPNVAAAKPTGSPTDAKYGVGFRMRWVSVPGWFLDLFTKKNVALSSYSWAIEGYRRKVDRDDPHRTWELSVAVGYQGMTPPDGYWLGKGKDLPADTDLVQVRGLSLITMDAAFISRQYFSRYFGIHYGAGLGLAVVRGKVLRASAVCNPATEQCQVIVANVCGGPNRPCTEADLKSTEGTRDNGPGDPHRFQETSVPSAIPIINLLFGLDFPIPDAKGLEFRIEGGFYDAFFLGGTMGYVF